jgi:hypothetical protein
MAHIVVKIGKSQIESIITRVSAEELGLKKGDVVKVVIKSTEVMRSEGLIIVPGCVAVPIILNCLADALPGFNFHQ